MRNEKQATLSYDQIDKLRRTLVQEHVQANRAALRSLNQMQYVFQDVCRELKELGVTQSRIGRRIKRSQCRVSQWATGQQAVPAQTLVHSLPILLDMLKEKRGDE